MLSAFGVDHGDISKGLPSAVRAGGGGSYGNLSRLARKSGRRTAKDIATNKYYPHDIETNINHGRTIKIGRKYDLERSRS